MSDKLLLEIREKFPEIEFRLKIKNKQLYLVPNIIPEWADYKEENHVTEILDEMDKPVTYEKFMELSKKRNDDFFLFADGIVFSSFDNSTDQIPVLINGKRELVSRHFNGDLLINNVGLINSKGEIVEYDEDEEINFL
ncbi:hypothetical protein [Acetobacter pasteurianus]|uniref:Uncharacterized protein n=1 Tax=Acetobacter pasteurianus subsp. pasteurianus TaxID=481145 RepID=A0A1Y0YAR2_ACEPA|nr:hypothetical protein [Acetobacter pasteurianus]ARW49487.1 hypothetical protein S1001342_03197 [Acetobacter pasteurianus subsp. pasteurianus]